MPTKKKLRAIVIGSGFGGLACALRLQKLGFETTCVEKNALPGGKATIFKEKNFTFDAGPTVITAPGLFFEIFELFSKKLPVELIPVDPFYQLVFPDGYKFNYTNNEVKLKTQIEAKNPKDYANYQKFLLFSKKVFDIGYTGLADKSFLTVTSMVKCIPDLIRLKAFKSVYQVVASFIKDPQLRQVFSFHSLLVGGSPFRTPSIYTLIHYLERKWGIYFPKGGTYALVTAFIELFEANGGTLLLQTEVDQILTKRDQKNKPIVTGVLLKSGEVLQADVVVSNADVVHTYGHLLGHEKKASWGKNRALKKSHAISLVVIYFGTKKQYPQHPHHQVIFGPRFKGLINDIFTKGILPDDFSLYLHRPTFSDPSAAPEGCDAFYVLSPVPNLKHKHVDWKAETDRYADKILTFLDQTTLPGLLENMVVKKVITPHYFESAHHAHLGAAFSVEPTLLQSAYFRVHNKDPHIQGLYLVGAGVHPGAGLPGVLNSAKATASVIHQDYEKRLHAL